MQSITCNPEKKTENIGQMSTKSERVNLAPYLVKKILYQPFYLFSASQSLRSRGTGLCISMYLCKQYLRSSTTHTDNGPLHDPVPALIISRDLIRVAQTFCAFQDSAQTLTPISEGLTKKFICGLILTDE